jgi:hypothetical protein
VKIKPDKSLKIGERISREFGLALLCSVIKKQADDVLMRKMDINVEKQMTLEVWNLKFR